MFLRINDTEWLNTELIQHIEINKKFEEATVQLASGRNIKITMKQLRMIVPCPRKLLQNNPKVIV